LFFVLGSSFFVVSQQTNRPGLFLASILHFSFSIFYSPFSLAPSPKNEERNSLSTGFTPMGATIGSYGFAHPCFFDPLGLRSNEEGGRGGCAWVAASRGSTGTRPVEAGHCDD
jgi:hypothetical protein